MQILINIILIINVFVCVALIAVVLLQRSEGGALGMGGGGPSGFMTTRGAGDLLTRVTWILGGIFFFLAMTQTVLSGKLHGGAGSLVDRINVQSLDLSTPQPSKPGQTAPAAPAPTSGAPGLQAPTPNAQQLPAGPQQPANDPFGILSAPTPQAPAPAPAPKKN